MTTKAKQLDVGAAEALEGTGRERGTALNHSGVNENKGRGGEAGGGEQPLISFVWLPARPPTRGQPMSDKQNEGVVEKGKNQKIPAVAVNAARLQGPSISLGGAGLGGARLCPPPVPVCAAAVFSSLRDRRGHRFTGTSEERPLGFLPLSGFVGALLRPGAALLDAGLWLRPVFCSGNGRPREWKYPLNGYLEKEIKKKINKKA